MTKTPVILSEQKLTPGQLRYWRAAARRLAGKVDLIDPYRRPLKELRQQFLGKTVYRASTGGRWGKSAGIVTL